jgi:hypothetical protein
VTATVIPFVRPTACPGHAGDRLTPAGIALIRRRYAREIATGRVSRIEWRGGDDGDGDTVHLVDADGKVLVSLCVDEGRVHAVSVLGSGGTAVGLGRTVAAALDDLAVRARAAAFPPTRTGIPAPLSPARPR